MSRRRPAEEGLLFDLPLERTPATPEPPVDIEQPGLPLDEEPDVPQARTVELDAGEPLREETPAAARHGGSGSTGVTLRQRAIAGLVDFGVCGAVLVVLLVALLTQGIRPRAADWPAGAVFLLAFSFLYAVLPLAFWGRTPGMTLAGLRASSRDGRPLTFRQAVLRWLGSALTVALAGLPLLVAVGGRSLSDLVSGSVTRRLDQRR